MPIKPQTVRLLDVFLIGPLMIWGGYAAAYRHRVAGLSLAALGFGTVVYNGYNWFRIREQNPIALQWY